MAYFRKRGKTWSFRISYQDTDGKNQIEEKGGFKTKAEASFAVAEVENKLKRGRFENPTITLYDFFTDWAEIYKKPYITEKTWQKYTATSKHIKNFMGEKRVVDITPTYYQQILNEFGKKFAQESIDHFHFQIKAAMKIAVREHLIDDNFAEFAVVKSLVAKRPLEEKFLEMDEYLSLIQKVKENLSYKSYLAIYLISVTGMRFAEVMGVTWDDIDFEKGLININKTWNYELYQDFAPTKNKSSIREVPIGLEMCQSLDDLRKNLTTIDSHNRVIGEVSNSIVNRTLKKIVGRNVHVHSLRHTYASYLILKGVDLMTISRILGHENLNITLSVYSHQLEELKEKNFIKIQDMF